MTASCSPLASHAAAQFGEPWGPACHCRADVSRTSNSVRGVRVTPSAVACGRFASGGDDFHSDTLTDMNAALFGVDLLLLTLGLGMASLTRPKAIPLPAAGRFARYN